MDITKLAAATLNKLVTDVQFNDVEKMTNGWLSIFGSKQREDRVRLNMDNMEKRQNAMALKVPWSKKREVWYEKNLWSYMPMFDVFECQETWDMSALHMYMFLDFVLFPQCYAN